MSRILSLAVSCTIVLAMASLASAQSPLGEEDRVSPERIESEGDHYGSSMLAPTPTQIIQYKAQLRAQQRMHRMASMHWYGMSASRPRASATPFTGMYGSVWQMPGGRPDAWVPRSPATVVLVR